MKAGRWYECWVTLVRGSSRGPELQVRRAWCESPGMLWGEPATQQACLDALKTPDPRTGRADWTHGLVCVRRPLGSRNLADEVTTTVYPTDRVEKYEGATPAHDEATLSRAEAREAEKYDWSQVHEAKISTEIGVLEIRDMAGIPLVKIEMLPGESLEHAKNRIFAQVTRGIYRKANP